MTAQPAHIDAVAAVNADALNLPVGERAARLILDSTDPAVHAAMLDALTRHGVLTEEWRWVEPFEPGDPKRRHRLVTPWEVAP